MNQLLTQLETLRNIPDSKRWPGALWPDDKAFKDARKFISGLPLALIPNPEIRLADDGEINFLWQNEDIHIDLGFYGTGTYSCFANTKDGKEISMDNVPVADGLSRAIIDLLVG